MAISSIDMGALELFSWSGTSNIEMFLFLSNWSSFLDFRNSMLTSFLRLLISWKKKKSKYSLNKVQFKIKFSHVTKTNLRIFSLIFKFGQPVGPIIFLRRHFGDVMKTWDLEANNNKITEDNFFFFGTDVTQSKVCSNKGKSSMNNVSKKN